MKKLFRGIVVIACLLLVLFIFPFSSHAIPPKPGPNFFWVAPHKVPDGTFIPGHWEYKGTPTPGKTWVPGHYGTDGTWIEGHWETIVPPKPGAVWVPGHYGPGGRWIPGHWK